MKVSIDLLSIGGDAITDKSFTPVIASCIVLGIGVAVKVKT